MFTEEDIATTFTMYAEPNFFFLWDQQRSMVRSKFYSGFFQSSTVIKKLKLLGLSPRANYTDRATAACRRSDCQLLRIRVPRGQRDGSLHQYSRFSRQEPLLFYQVAPQLYSRD
jgi:hypothetical protein